jgi:hypothetical protein
VNLMPSANSIRGQDSRNDSTVITEKRFMSSMASLSPARSFLLRTFLDWLVRLDAMALQNPVQLKETSVNEAKATPPTIGTSEPSTGREGTSPRKRAERRTVKKGSEALMVWVKETATLPRLMLVNTVPSMCPKASGAILPNCSRKSCTQIRKQQTKNKLQVFSVVDRENGLISPHKNLDHFSICACHPCAGAMLIFSVSFQFL